jgi:hypothetical protein
MSWPTRVCSACGHSSGHDDSCDKARDFILPPRLGEIHGWGSGLVDVASGDVLRIKMKAIAEARGEPKLTERPILVLPVSKYFASVYKICQAMVDSSSKPGDA